jgi:fructose-bisphosphate aldolase class I
MADPAALSKTAQALVAPAKGILAADESTGTIKRRLDSIGADNTEENRRDYREMLFRTPGVEAYLSGVILYDETLRQKGADGTPLVDVLTRSGIIPGIKVDTGAKALAGAPGELVTEGLDGLRERALEYYALGARFAKWRAVITIGAGIPTSYCIDTNAHALARYAAISQEAGLVPIVEPEVLMDGDHSIERCEEATEATLREVFRQLAAQRVSLEGMLLKPNMAVSGSDAKNRAGTAEVAERTVRVFARTVPAAMPGIVFLSGGQPDDEATLNLQSIAKEGERVCAPWQLSYSYGRGLQALPLKTWGGKKENVAAAQKAFAHRCRLTSAARQGTYSSAMEKELASA